MSHTAEKFIAVILAIWLPLFSGNALAASVAMQAMVGKHHSAVAQPGEPPQHCALTVQQNTHPAQLDVNLDQSADHSSQKNQSQQKTDQQNSAGENCGTCHFACCGYLAAATVEVTKVKPLAWLFASLSTQFQSITLIPLDPPPLARV